MAYISFFIKNIQGVIGKVSQEYLRLVEMQLLNLGNHSLAKINRDYLEVGKS